MRKICFFLLFSAFSCSFLAACSNLDQKEMLARIKAAEDASARAQARADEALKKAEEALKAQAN